jgi:hypothetical protein
MPHFRHIPFSRSMSVATLPAPLSPLSALAAAALSSERVYLEAGEVYLIDGAAIEVLSTGDMFVVARVDRHRTVQGQLQFLVVYAGYESQPRHWQPLSDFLAADDSLNTVVQQYCEARRLCL